MLPLANLSGDADQEFFVDGMTEALITELSQISALKVISRTSVMQYKDAQQALPEIARELGVDAIVEGSVLRAGDQVRVTARLIHAETDELLWAERFDRELTNILALHSDVARAIAGEVRVVLTPEEERRLADRRAVDPAAYDAVLTGSYHLSRFPQGIEPAIEAFERAIDLDPTYARAYAGLASTLNVAGYYLLDYMGVNLAETFANARAAAEQALALDDSLAEAYTALGTMHLSHDWDWAAAERNLSRALELNPGSIDAHFWYGLYLVWVESRFDEGVALTRRAIELDPASLPTRMRLGATLYFTREFGEAIDLLTDVIDADSTYTEPYTWLSFALIGDGRYDEAVEVAQRPMAAPWLRLWIFPLAYGLSGRREEALELLAETDLAGSSQYQYLIAAGYGAVGEHDLAFETLERAYERREPLFNQFRVDPRMDSLRDDPRFDEFVARMNYP